MIINRIIHFSVYHRAIVLMFTVMIAVLGWISFQSLPIDAVPDVTNVQVQINSTVEGLVPEEIERNVTYPVETAMSGVAGVNQIRSTTRFGLSQVTVVFEDDIDIYRARQLVSERLQTVITKFPRNVQTKLGPVSTGLGEIFRYSVEAKDIAKGENRINQLRELRAIQEWYIKPRLLTVKGVADVNTIGGHEKQFHVMPDVKKMVQYGLHFNDILDALQRTNQNAGGGYVQQTGEQFLIQAVGLLKSMDDIRAVPIKTLETFKTVTIGDVAEVGFGKELRMGAATVLGEEKVIGSTFMLMGENSRTVSIRVAERIQEIGSGLPTGYKIDVLYDRSDLVNATLKTVLHNLLTGALLVVIILLFLIGNIRAALITAVTIPFSLLITFVFMSRFGISGNLMSLGALDFGIIVDGTVIVLDNCVRFIQEKTRSLGRNLTHRERQRAVFEAAVEIRTAAGFGELIIVVVFLPIFALVGVEGKMFKPMAATFSIAVIAALILSFTTVPALASWLLSGNVSDKEPKLMELAKRCYGHVLDFILKYKNRTILLGLLSVIFGGIIFARLGGEFLPQLDEGSLVVEMFRPANISMDQAVALQEKSEKIISEFPEVAFPFSIIGTAEIAADPMGVNQADAYVIFKDRSEWPEVNGRQRNPVELKEAIRTRLEAELPGQRILLSQPIQMRFNELLEGTRADVTVKVFGEDMNILTEITRSIAAVTSKVKGAGDVEVELRGTSPLLKITPKGDYLRKLGVSSIEVLETVGVALGGEAAGYLHEGIRRFPIVIRLSEKDRSDLEAIRNLPVGIAANATVPLKEIATIKFEQAYGFISREQSKRRAAVMINVRGRDTESFVEEARAIVQAEVKTPPGYYVEWGGNFKNLQEARSRLLILTPLALVLVLMMIYIAFNSIIKTILIFSGVPLALVGGVLGLLLNRLPFSISAGVGFIALSGIAVLNGVVLVNYFNHLRKKGLTGKDLVKKGALIRLRPVLMTALVDIFGFLPMMLSTGAGSEVQKPLASVVIGGIVSSTLLTLLVLPVLYRQFERWIQRESS